MGRAYKDLVVWQRSMELTVAIYRLTDLFPKSEMFGLSSQMRRAAVAIPSNIAEGSGRNTKKDFRQFVAVAKGSVCELHTQILIAKRLGYATPEQLKMAATTAVEIRKMLSGLSAYLAGNPVKSGSMNKPAPLRG